MDFEHEVELIMKLKYYSDCVQCTLWLFTIEFLKLNELHTVQGINNY